MYMYWNMNSQDIFNNVLAFKASTYMCKKRAYTF